MSKDELILEKSDGVRLIKFNRPSRRNAINFSIYIKLAKTLNEDANDDSIAVTIITGVGNYYSSGNDIESALQGDSRTGLEAVHDLVNAFIKYPKLLISVVNGPAIGIAATSAALCDIVYATENAVFDTPFLKLGLCCEASSSFTFPLILGRSKASEVLLLGEKLSAQDALRLGFISKIIPQSQIEAFINDLRKHGKLSVNSIKLNKKLITKNFDNILCECNRQEIDQIWECLQSEEFTNAVVKFMSRKSKL